MEWLQLTAVLPLWQMIDNVAEYTVTGDGFHMSLLSYRYLNNYSSDNMRFPNCLDYVPLPALSFFMTIKYYHIVALYHSGVQAQWCWEISVQNNSTRGLYCFHLDSYYFSTDGAAAYTINTMLENLQSRYRPLRVSLLRWIWSRSSILELTTCSKKIQYNALQRYSPPWTFPHFITLQTQI